jgi:enterochelin esterase family protein
MLRTGSSPAAVVAIFVTVVVAAAGVARAAEPAALDAYVGRYQLEADKVLSVTRFRDRLYAYTTGDPAHALAAAGDDRFSLDRDEAVVTFEKDANGKVARATFERGKSRWTGEKVSDNPRQNPPAATERFDSPRIAKLAEEIKRGDPKAALENFWNEVRDKAPIVEEFSGDPHSSWVTFVYRGEVGTKSVKLDGAIIPQSHDPRAMSLTRLGDTDLWYRTERLRNDTRCVYGFGVNMSGPLPEKPMDVLRVYQENLKADPLNPRFLDATWDYFPAFSVLELPEAPATPFVAEVKENPKGTLVERAFHSDVLKQDRNIAVYTPPGFDGKASAEYPLLVLFDGQSYHDPNSIPAHTIIDNLVAAKRLAAPPVVVFVNSSKERNKELAFFDPFVDFVVKELVPWARANYHATANPARTIIGGLSLGGVAATYCALKHPDVFGNVLSQSGAFWVYPGYTEKNSPMFHEGSLAAEFLKSPKLPVRFYLEAGRYEGFFPSDLLGENRRLRDVLRAKGYDVTYNEFTGGHQPISWRATFADALMAVSGS